MRGNEGRKEHDLHLISPASEERFLAISMTGRQVPVAVVVVVVPGKRREKKADSDYHLLIFRAKKRRKRERERFPSCFHTHTHTHTHACLHGRQTHREGGSLSPQMQADRSGLTSQCFSSRTSTFFEVRKKKHTLTRLFAGLPVSPRLPCRCKVSV